MTFCKNRSSGRTGRHGMLSSSPTGQKSGDNHRKRPSKHKIYLRRTLSYIISGKDAFEGLDRWVRTKDRASSLSIQFHMVVPSDNQSPMRVAPVIQENQGHAFSCPICNFRAVSATASKIVHGKRITTHSLLVLALFLNRPVTMEFGIIVTRIMARNSAFETFVWKTTR